jgi:hypothetical protein
MRNDPVISTYTTDFSMCVVVCVQTDLTVDQQLQQRGAGVPVFGKPPPSTAPSQQQQQQQIIAATRF